MKKYAIIFVNLILLIIFVLIFEYFCYLKLVQDFKIYEFEFKVPRFLYDNRIEKDMQKRYDKNYTFHFCDYDKKSDKSLIVTGCSVAYGFKYSNDTFVMKDKETISYKLSDALGLTVYNRAIPAGSLNKLFYLLNTEDFYKNIKKEPEYVLYFYLKDQMRRLISRCTPMNPDEVNIFYNKNVNNRLKQRKYFLYEQLYFYNLLVRKMINSPKKSKIFEKYLENTFYCYLKEVQNTIKEHYPDCKFVFVKLSDGYDFEDKILSKYNCIDIPKLTGIDIMHEDDKYLADKLHHPNELYWDTILPILTEKLKSF